MIMMKLGKTEIAKEQFYVANKPIQIWNINVDNIVTSGLVKAKNTSKYLIGYLDEDTRRLVLIVPKMTAYAKRSIKAIP